MILPILLFLELICLIFHFQQMHQTDKVESQLIMRLKSKEKRIIIINLFYFRLAAITYNLDTYHSFIPITLEISTPFRINPKANINLILIDKTLEETEAEE